jgi:hypothetical protein
MSMTTGLWNFCRNSIAIRGIDDGFGIVAPLT